MGKHHQRRGGQKTDSLLINNRNNKSTIKETTTTRVTNPLTAKGFVVVLNCDSDVVNQAGKYLDLKGGI